MNSKASLLSLPYETHVEIFRLLDLKDISSLGQTCILLRNETITTPELWTTIDLDRFPTSTELFLERADNLDLALINKKELPYDAQPAVVFHIGQLVSSLLPRLSSLRLSALTSGCWGETNPSGISAENRFPPTTLNQPASKLQLLELSSFPNIHYPIFAGSTAILHTLVLHGVSLSLDGLPLCNLSSLTMDHVRVGNPHSTQAIVDIVNSCRQLRYLKLADVIKQEYHQHPLETNYRLSLPFLETLDVSQEFHSAMPIIAAFIFVDRLKDVRLYDGPAGFFHCNPSLTPVLRWMADFSSVSLWFFSQPAFGSIGVMITGYTTDNRRHRVTAYVGRDSGYRKICSSATHKGDLRDLDDSFRIPWSTIRQLTLIDICNDYDDLIIPLLAECTELSCLVIKSDRMTYQGHQQREHRCIKEGLIGQKSCPNLEECWLSTDSVDFELLSDLIEARNIVGKDQEDFRPISKVRIISENKAVPPPRGSRIDVADIGAGSDFESEAWYGAVNKVEKHDPVHLARFSQLPQVDGKWAPTFGDLSPKELKSSPFDPRLDDFRLESLRVR